VKSGQTQHLDLNPPTLTVFSPADGFQTYSVNVTVSGYAYDDVGLASVTINGTKVTLGANGSFSKTLRLAGGLNTITIIATDTSANQTKVIRKVTLLDRPPVLFVFKPINNSVVYDSQVFVCGYVWDDVGISSVTVDGKKISLGWKGYYRYFETTTELVAGLNKIVIMATDTNGNTSKVIRRVTSKLSVISASLLINPDTLNIPSSGRWMTAYIEIPSGQNVSAKDIDLSSIEIKDKFGVKHLIDSAAPSEVVDSDNDGVSELMVKLDRSDLADSLKDSLGWEDGQSDEATVDFTINGGFKNSSCKFKGSDSIRVINQGTEGKGRDKGKK